MFLEVGHFFDGLQASPLVREVERFKYMRERSVVTTYSLYRSLQVEEARLLDGSSQLCPKAPRVGSLVTDDTPTSLDDGLEDGVPVPGEDTHQVDHLRKY